MPFERWGKEQKEKQPTMEELLRDGWKAFRIAANAISYVDENEGTMKQRGLDALSQLTRHPESFKEIAINLGADLVDGFQERERKQSQVQTEIHRKTAAVMARFRQRQTEQQEANQQEQEAARHSQEASHEIDGAITTGIKELTAWLNERSGRKPKK